MPIARRPTAPDSVAMLTRAAQELDRLAALGRAVTGRPPGDALADLDHLLLMVGCWEARWLAVSDAEKQEKQPRSGSRIARQPLGWPAIAGEVRQSAAATGDAAPDRMKEV